MQEQEEMGKGAIENRSLETTGGKRVEQTGWQNGNSRHSHSSVNE